MAQLTTNNAAYRQRLDAAPKRDVTHDEFRAAALLAGWKLRTIRLFTAPPLFSGYVKVGEEGLRLIPCPN